MTAGIHDIVIEVGATFELSVVWKDPAGVPINLTGYDARMMVRKKHASVTALLSFSTLLGTITLGGVLGTIVVLGVATLTDDLVDKYGVYDLELISPDGHVYRVLEGSVEIRPEVTRP